MTDHGLKLFDAAPWQAGHAVSDVSDSSRGVAGEHFLAYQLLRRGHQVAFPLLDDGIDLIVDSRICVQVKTTTRRSGYGTLKVNLNRTRSHTGGRQTLSPRTDVLAVLAWDSEEWWLIPRDVLEAKGLYQKSALYLREGSTVGPSVWRSAWDVFRPRSTG